MTSHLFLFTIGPVQSFIAQARKTRDLYAGSRILSELVHEAKRAFKEVFPSGEVIFPRLLEKGALSLPNRLVAEVTADESELREKAEQIQRAVEERWQAMAEQALKEAGVSTKPAGFDEQIKALPDIHWVFTPLSGSDYARAYLRLERLGGAVKNIRPFAQMEETGRKCSIDGVNNALFCSWRSTPAYVKDPVRIRGFRLSAGEALSAVSLTKRFYPLEGGSFPSTAEVALMHDEAQLTAEEKQRLECFKKLFDREKVAEACIEMLTNGYKEKVKLINPREEEDWNDEFDYQMLFEENLNEKNIPNKTQRELLQDLLAPLKKRLQTRYYALVLFDGDQMGKWLSGENNQSRDDLKEFHRALSGALAEFTQAAEEHLNRENGNGRVIYAGGDDFLGFVNIHHLFGVMKHLRTEFDRVVNQSIAEYKKEGQHLTFSAGVVIAHYKTPLSEVLEKARKVEKAAKKEGDRNAFGIAVMKHSGEIQEAVYKWDRDEKSPSGCSNWEALERIYLALNKDGGNFSHTFIQNLTTEIVGLTGRDLRNLLPGDKRKAIGEGIRLEIRRLVDRSWKDPKKKAEGEITELSDKVSQLWEQVPRDSDHRPRHFVHALHIADFLTRKTTQS